MSVTIENERPTNSADFDPIPIFPDLSFCLFRNIVGFQLVNCAHAQERVIDKMWGMAFARSLARSLARLVDSCKLFLDFRLLSAFDSFWRAINRRNGDLCC